MSRYDPDLLDRLCLGGSAMWARLSPHPGKVLLSNVASISVFPREDAEFLVKPATTLPDLGPIAQDVRRFMQDRGACFLSDLVRGTGHSQGEVEQALWELSASGIVTADGFENLRTLLQRGRRRAQSHDRKNRTRHAAGRWSLMLAHKQETTQSTEHVARRLLKRYGIVFRDLLARESFGIAWRDLLVQYRRMELRGEIRGGRFVDGFVGEQFALPEAVESLRAMRRKSSENGALEEVKIAAADPLNLVGIIVPGTRVPSNSNSFVVYRNGVPVEDAEISQEPIPDFSMATSGD